MVNIFTFEFGFTVLLNHQPPSPVSFGTVLNLGRFSVVFPIFFSVIAFSHEIVVFLQMEAPEPTSEQGVGLQGLP